MIWIVLSLATIAYLALATVVGRHLLYNDVVKRTTPPRAGLAAFDVEDVEFRSSDDLTLRGWFLKSPGNPGNRTVIVVHGWQRDRSRVVEHIQLLVANGFHVLAYDQRGHGASDTGLISYGEGEAHDLLAAIDYLSTRSDVSVDRLGAMGFSLGSGGIVYAIALAERPIFRAVILEGVFSESYDVGKYMLTRKLGPALGYVVGIALFTVGAKIWTLGRFQHGRPVDLAAKIAPTPLMIIRGKNDHMVPDKSASQFIANAKDPKIVWVHEKGRHSDAYMTYPDEYKQRVLSFLDEHLGAVDSQRITGAKTT
jgi:uncharacterized protein